VSLHKGVLTIESERKHEEKSEEASSCGRSWRRGLHVARERRPPALCNSGGRCCAAGVRRQQIERGLPGQASRWHSIAPAQLAMPPPAPRPQLPLPLSARALQEGKLKWVERTHGRFRRAFVLPGQGTEAEKISARLVDGVMTLTVPKAPAPPKPPVKEIPVE
jgi:hypothetical protein